MKKFLLFGFFYCYCHFFSISQYRAFYLPESDSAFTLLKPSFSTPAKDSTLPYKAFRRKLLHENLIVITDSAERFHFTVDPLMHFQLGRELEYDTVLLYQNSRGFVATGRIGKDFSFETTFLESQARYKSYVEAFADGYKVIPGMGRWKTFKVDDYDFASSSGYISWDPCRYFSIQAGHGKHFVGEGYRSLLLSDNAFNYPYLRLNHTWGKFRYTNVYAVLMNLRSSVQTIPPGTERIFQKKPMAFHTLDWRLSRKFQLGFFQGLIWNAADTLNRVKMGVGFFNPVIFSNAAFYGLNDEKNIWTGLNFKWTVFKGFSLYGQGLLDALGDSLSLKKYGGQIGLQYKRVAPKSCISARAEFNTTHVFTYTQTFSDQSITHYAQPLAHPLGAGFTESILIVDYKYRRLLVHAKVNLVNYDASVLGGNYIWTSDSISIVPYLSEPIKIFNAEGYLGVLINPKTNLQFCVGAHTRNLSISAYNLKFPSLELFVCLRTQLWNQYLDF